MGDGISDAYSGKFPAADANAELHPGQNKDFKVDSASNEISNREIRGGGEPPKKNEKNSLQSLKITVLVSAAMVSLAGVVIVITKKLKEKEK